MKMEQNQEQNHKKINIKLIAAIVLAVIATVCIAVLIGKIKEPASGNNNTGNGVLSPTAGLSVATATVAPTATPTVTLTPTVTPSPTETPTPTPTPTRGIIVMLDPGHGCSKGVNNYDRGTDGGWGDSIHTAVESEMVCEIALNVRTLLQQQEIIVLMTRETEEDPGLSVHDRYELANSSDIDAYISIHMNSYVSDRSIHGIETYFNSKTNDNNKTLAQFIQDGVVGATGAKDRYIRTGNDLGVLKSNKPSCLVEVGFLSSSTEWELLVSENYRQKIAEGIAEGIINYLNWVATNE